MSGMQNIEEMKILLKVLKLAKSEGDVDLEQRAKARLNELVVETLGLLANKFSI